MKPLSERLKEKEALLLKERMKMSGRVKSFSVSIPYYGHPYINTEGDRVFVTKRAQEVIATIKRKTSSTFYNELKRLMNEMDRPATKSKPVSSTVVAPANPTPATPAVAPAASITSPGVSVRESSDNTTPEPPAEIFERAFNRYFDTPEQVNEDDPRRDR